MSEHRIVKAVHAVRDVVPDPPFEIGLADFLRENYSRDGLLELYGRFCAGLGATDSLMRRAVWRALARSFGHGVLVQSGARFKHVETFEIHDGVYIGEDSYIQGRFDGTCVIGKNTWVGPSSYLDARHLMIGDYVGWGPGAKLLGSAHVGERIDEPIISTELEILPVVIEDWADIGMNAVIMPGVRVGKGSIVGASAVVTKDVPPFSVVAGVPARFLHWREGYQAK